MEKAFAGGSQTAKFMKVFSLDSSPLYGIVGVVVMEVGDSILGFIPLDI